MVAQLLESIVALDYPRNLLQIQVLDDSNDETSALIARKAVFYKKQGIKIEHIQRKRRLGFKAGALAKGLKTAKGEFICIFDADFTPKTDFLQKTIAHFHKNDKLALVQTRWQHRNQTQSFLTHIQAMQLNVHFTIEQGGRNNADFFTQFNGTAGIWRRTAIEDAGGWQTDTLTEDLDLSYRAQLANWQILYDETIGTPAELPNSMRDLQAQQFRWTKGGAECARKLLPIILKCKQPFWHKFHACLHLFSSSIFVSMLLIVFSSLVLVILKTSLPFRIDWLILFFSNTIFLTIAHFTANVLVDENNKKGFDFQRFIHFSFYYPVLLAVSMGLSWRNTIAAYEGWSGKKSPFVRTPKKGNFSEQKNNKIKAIFQNILNHQLEFFLALILVFVGCKELVTGVFTMPFFYFLWAIGFGLVAIMD